METTSIAVMVIMILIVLLGIKKLSQLVLLFGSDIILRGISIAIDYLKTGELHFERLIYSPIGFYDSLLPQNIYLGLAGLSLWVIAIFSSLYEIMGKFVKNTQYRKGLTVFIGTLFFFGFGNGLPNATRMFIIPALSYVGQIFLGVVEELIAMSIAGFLIYTIPKIYRFIFKENYDEGMEALKIQEEIYKKLGVRYKKIKIDDLSELWRIRGEPFFTKKGIYVLVSEDDYYKLIRKKKKRYGEPPDLEKIKEFLSQV